MSSAKQTGQTKNPSLYDPKEEQQMRLWDRLSEETKSNLIKAYPELKRLNARTPNISGTN